MIIQIFKEWIINLIFREHPIFVSFQDYILTLSVDEVREYIKNLLIALRRVHKFDVIHRDVKPSNFLYDSATKQ